MVLPAGLSPATTTFEASHSDNLSYGSIEMVGRLGLAPLAQRHALVSTEARLACPVDIPNWSAWQDSHPQPSRSKRDASANWATRGWCPRSDLHRHCARFKGAVSALDYVG